MTAEQYLFNHKGNIARLEMLKIKRIIAELDIIHSSPSGDSSGIRGNKTSDTTLDKVIRIEKSDKYYEENLKLIECNVRLVNNAITVLKKKEREVVEMFFFEGMTNNEIVKELIKKGYQDISYDTVRRLKRNSIKELTKYLPCTESTQ